MSTELSPLQRFGPGSPWITFPSMAAALCAPSQAPGLRAGGQRSPTLCGRSGVAWAEALGKNTQMSRGGKQLSPEHPLSEHQIPELWGLGHGQRVKPRSSLLSVENVELLEASTADSACAWTPHPGKHTENPWARALGQPLSRTASLAQGWWPGLSHQQSCASRSRTF